MALEELERKLYKPQEQKKPSEPSYRRIRPVAEEEERPEEGRAGEQWEEEKKRPPMLEPKQKKTLKIVFWVVIILIIAAGSAFYILRKPFAKEQVAFTLTGPKEVRVGEPIKFTVRYKNNSPVVLTGAELIFSYPVGVVLVGGPKVEPGKSGATRYSLGSIGVGGEGTQEFPLRLIGEVDNSRRVEAKLTYRPETSSSRFENAATADVTIAAHGLVLDLEAPQKVLAGESINYAVRYSNIAKVPFSSVRVEISYPDNFSFQSSDPAPNIGDNVWTIDEVAPDIGGQIFIKGVLRGNEGESKALKASIGIEEDRSFIPFREARATSQIASSPILIAASVNDVTDYVAFPGDTLKYKITYKNNASVGLREIVLKAQLSGKMFDYATLKTDSGSFDGRTGTITWTAGNVPQFLVLNPGEGGELNFEIRLRKDYPIQTFADKNFTVNMASTIETRSSGLFLAQEKITRSTEIVSKVASRLSGRAKGYFNSPTGLLTNTGPLPPRVNQTTTYLIHWQIINFSNDAEDVILKTILPQGVNWTGSAFSLRSETKPEYNERTGEVMWNVGKAPAGAGVVLPALEVAFQVSVTPTPAQTGRLISILGPSTVSGKDSFTGLSLSETIGPIPSDLPDDPSVGFNEGVVQ